MTTTATRPARTPTAPAPHHSEWAHGPVAAAINGSILALLAAMLGRITHLPPGWALAAGAAMAVTFAAAGRLRHPRPLSGRSVAYRSTAMLAVGVWLWAQTVDFARIGRGAYLALALGLLTAALVIPSGVLLRRRPRTALVTALVALIPGGLAYHLAAGSNAVRLVTATGPLNKWMLLPWAWHATLSLLILAAVFAVLGAACATHERDEEEARLRLLARAATTRDMLAMQQLLREEVAAPGLLVVKPPVLWPGGAGETYELDTTVDGVTVRRLDHCKETLATKLNLDEGCGVEFVKGSSRGRVLMEVTRVNRLADDQPYPTTYVQRSVYNPLPVGILRAGSEVGVTLRQSSAYVWAQKGTGKTGVLYAIEAGLLQCTDALVCVIDLGGGGAALPYLYAWAEGRAAVPAIDWVAPDMAEARIMVDFWHDVAVDRKSFYAWRKRTFRQTLMPLDAEVPQIVIVVDEGAQIMGANKRDLEARAVRDKLEDLMKIGRDVGVNVVFSGLDATEETAPRSFLAQCAIRIGMRVTDQRELAYGFDDYNLDPAEIPYPGCGFILAGPGEAIRAYKGYLLDMAQMDDVAVATAEWRPALDARGQELGLAPVLDPDDVELGKRNPKVISAHRYKLRWARTAGLLKDEKGVSLLTPERIAALVGGAAGDVSAAPSGHDPDCPCCQPPAPQHPKPKPFLVVGTPEELLARADKAAEGLAAEPSSEGWEDDGEADDTVAGYEPGVVAAAREIMSKVDWSDPLTWPEPGPPPPGVEERANPQGQTILEALVRYHGAAGVAYTAGYRLLVGGGPWGAAVPVSAQTYAKWLKPGGVPVGWLADRQGRGRGAPYVHRDFTPPA